MRGAKQKRRSHGFTIGAFAVGGGATKGRILQEYSPVRERTTCPFSPRKLQLRHSPGGRSNKERSSKCIPPHQSKHNLHIRREGGATRRGAPSVFPLSQNTTCTFTGRVQLRRVKKQAGQCPAQNYKWHIRTESRAAGELQDHNPPAPKCKLQIPREGAKLV